MIILGKTKARKCSDIRNSQTCNSQYHRAYIVDVPLPYSLHARLYNPWLFLIFRPQIIRIIEYYSNTKRWKLLHVFL
jgi:hypothetical protein